MATNRRCRASRLGGPSPNVAVKPWMHLHLPDLETYYDGIRCSRCPDIDGFVPKFRVVGGTAKKRELRLEAYDA